MAKKEVKTEVKPEAKTEETIDFARLSPFAFTTVSGRYIIRQAANRKHAEERFATEFPQEKIQEIHKVQ